MKSSASAVHNILDARAVKWVQPFRKGPWYYSSSTRDFS